MAESAESRITRFALFDLKQLSCRCGSGKAAGRTFCRTCYYTLPEATRKGLYSRIGKGYEAFYVDALKGLAAFGRLQLPEWVP